jgi:hypothetical protein
MIVVVCCGTCLTVTLFNNNKMKLLNKSQLEYPVVSLSSLMPSPLPFHILILSHISSIHHMVNIRNHHANANNENNSPPPPTLEQVLMTQAQILQTMQRAMVSMQQNQHTPQLQQRDRHGDF